MRARIIRAYIAKPKNIPLISLISQYTRPRDKRDKRVIFPLDSHIYARGREKQHPNLLSRRAAEDAEGGAEVMFSSAAWSRGS